MRVVKQVSKHHVTYVLAYLLRDIATVAASLGLKSDIGIRANQVVHRKATLLVPTLTTITTRMQGTYRTSETCWTTRIWPRIRR